MEKFVKVLAEKQNVKALLIGARIYVNCGVDVGHIVALPLKGQHKGHAYFGKEAYQPLQYNEAYQPFMTDDEGEAYYLFYNGVDKASTHICLIETGEILPVVNVVDLLYSKDLQEYLGEFTSPELAKIVLEFLSRFESWKDAWACVTRQGHAPYGVDRQVQAIHIGLSQLIHNRQCGIGKSATDWTTRVFPRFRAVLREWEKTGFVESLL